jgi:hypothetical protein
MRRRTFIAALAPLRVAAPPVCATARQIVAAVEAGHRTVFLARGRIALPATLCITGTRLKGGL